MPSRPPHTIAWATGSPVPPLVARAQRRHLVVCRRRGQRLERPPAIDPCRGSSPATRGRGRGIDRIDQRFLCAAGRHATASSPRRRLGMAVVVLSPAAIASSVSAIAGLHADLPAKHLRRLPPDRSSPPSNHADLRRRLTNPRRASSTPGASARQPSGKPLRQWSSRRAAGTVTLRSRTPCTASPGSPGDRPLAVERPAC